MRKSKEAPFVFGVRVEGDSFTDRREETERLKANFTYGVNTILISPIIRKTKCFRILERNAKISKTKRNFSRLYPTPQKFKKIDRLRRNEIHLKAVRTSS